MSGATDEKSFLITGGTKGIGYAIAHRIAAPGAQLFLCFLSDEAAAEQARGALVDRGATVHLIKRNVGSPEEAKHVVDEVARRVTRLDGLVHCAADPNPGYLVEQDLEEIEETIRVGGLALLYLVQPAMKLLGEGSSVIFLSGAATETVLPMHGALALAKAAGECIVRYLALECAPRKVNVNTLQAGPIDTELYRKSRPDGRPPAVTPAGRPLSAADVAETAAFLLSPSAAMVRGQSIMVDGGLNTTIRMEK